MTTPDPEQRIGKDQYCAREWRALSRDGDRLLCQCECGCDERRAFYATHFSRGLISVCQRRKRAAVQERMADRFWAKVDKDGPRPAHVPGIGSCWQWTASLLKTGYGQFTICVGGKRKNAHAPRVAWELVNGPIVGGLWVLHRCDNRRCVNPDHLWLGTNDDNVKDMWRKNRGNRIVPGGERAPSAKLRADQVRSIRDMYATGSYSQQALGRVFGVTQGQIKNIVLRKQWVDVP